MKYFLITLLLFSPITIHADSNLTSDDLLKIQKIVENTVDKSEKRIKEYVDTKIDSVEKRISLVTTLVYALIALIVLGIGIPQFLIARKSSITNEQEK